MSTIDETGGGEAEGNHVRRRAATTAAEETGVE
jgi:hypothetical protein